MSTDPAPDAPPERPDSHTDRKAPDKSFPVALLLGLLILVVGGIGILAYLAPEGPEERVTLEPGDPLPDFELPSLDGRTVSRADLEELDGPVILNFWATWCKPCLREIPALRRLHQLGAAEVVSIALDDGGEAVVRPFVEEERIEYPVLLAESDLLYQRFDSLSIPYTLVLDDDLRIRSIHRAVVSERTLEKDLADARRPWQADAGGDAG